MRLKHFNSSGAMYFLRLFSGQFMDRTPQLSRRLILKGNMSARSRSFRRVHFPHRTYSDFVKNRTDKKAFDVKKVAAGLGALAALAGIADYYCSVNDDPHCGRVIRIIFGKTPYPVPSDENSRIILGCDASTSFYVERETVKKVGIVLDSNNVANAVRILSIIGTPGSGKSELAKQFARKLESRLSKNKRRTYYIRFINAENAGELEGEFFDIAGQLGVPVKDSKGNRKDNKTIVSDIYKKLSRYEDWLLIFDNVNTFSDVSEYIRMAAGMDFRNGRIILTSRDVYEDYRLFVSDEPTLKTSQISKNRDIYLFKMDNGKWASTTTVGSKKISKSFLQSDTKEIDGLVETFQNGQDSLIRLTARKELMTHIFSRLKLPHHLIPDQSNGVQISTLDIAPEMKFSEAVLLCDGILQHYAATHEKQTLAIHLGCLMLPVYKAASFIKYQAEEKGNKDLYLVSNYYKRLSDIYEKKYGQPLKKTTAENNPIEFQSRISHVIQIMTFQEMENTIAKEIIKGIAFIAPEVSQFVIESYLSEKFKDASSFDITLMANKAISELDRFGLVRCIGSGKIFIHRKTQEAIIEILDEEGEKKSIGRFWNGDPRGIVRHYKKEIAEILGDLGTDLYEANKGQVMSQSDLTKQAEILKHLRYIKMPRPYPYNKSVSDIELDTATLNQVDRVLSGGYTQRYNPGSLHY